MNKPSIGCVYCRTDRCACRYKDALPLFEQVLQLRTKLLGKDHPYVATATDNVARTKKCIK